MWRWHDCNMMPSSQDIDPGRVIISLFHIPWEVWCRLHSPSPSPILFDKLYTKRLKVILKLLYEEQKDQRGVWNNNCLCSVLFTTERRAGNVSNISFCSSCFSHNWSVNTTHVEANFNTEISKLKFRDIQDSKC